MEQRTDEWFAARLGKVTASKIADVVAKTKTGYSTSRENYMAQLICERLTGMKADSYSNAAMEWGTQNEPFARAQYELVTNQLVREVGFVDHPYIPMAGASPDGLIGDDGLVEIKCPNTATHFDTLLSDAIPSKYLYQMQWQMACTGRQWNDFVSFDPRAPEGLKYYCKRLERSDTVIAMLQNEVSKFLDDLQRNINILETKRGT